MTSTCRTRLLYPWIPAEVIDAGEFAGMSDADLRDFIVTEVQALGIELPDAQGDSSAKR
jgi:hypothetical protein